MPVALMEKKVPFIPPRPGGALGASFQRNSEQQSPGKTLPGYSAVHPFGHSVMLGCAVSWTPTASLEQHRGYGLESTAER